MNRRALLTRLGFALGFLANATAIVDHVPGTGLRLALVLLNGALLGLAWCALPPLRRRALRAQELRGNWPPVEKA